MNRRRWNILCLPGRRLAAILGLSLLVGFAAGCVPGEEEDIRDLRFSVELAGDNEIPAVATPATGEMDVRLQDRLLTIEGSFEGLVSRLQDIEGTPIHVHVGDLDEVGPVVFPVSVDADEDERSGTFSLTETLTADQVRLFEEGRYYVNIHTFAYPGGELRGQMDEDAPTFARVSESWGVQLSDTAQPHAVTTDGEGWLWAILRADDTFILSGAAENLSSDLTAVELQQGVVGEAGPTIFTLETEERTDMTNVHRFYLERTLTETQINDLEDGFFYLNVITEDFPDGELRGQLDETDGFFIDLWETIVGEDPETIRESPPF